NTGNRTPTTEQRHTMSLDLLIEERRHPWPAAHTPQQDVAVVRDVADDVADFVECAGEQTLRGAAAERERHVADAIASRTGEQGKQAVAHRLFVAGYGGHAREANGQTVGILERQDDQQQLHDILLARSSTTRGNSRCSASNTRAASDSGVSPVSMRTRSCAMIAPRSNSSSTKCTVAPDSFAPLASTAAWTCWPYIPGPPKSGNRAGWMLIIRPRKRETTAAGISFMYPANTTSCASPSAPSSSAASAGSRSTVVATPERRARSSAPAAGRFEMTRVTRAMEDAVRLSRRACRFVPPPDTSAATRTG